MILAPACGLRSALVIALLLSPIARGLAQLRPAPADVPLRAVREQLRMGSEGDERETLGGISRVLVGPDLRVYVGQPQERTIRVFDAQGRAMAMIGQKGSGPGEFESMSAIGLIADTLVIHDRVQGRVTRFDLDGTVLRTERAAPVVAESREMSVIALLQGDRGLFTRSLRDTDFGPGRSRVVPVAVAPLAGGAPRAVSAVSVSRDVTQLRLGGAGDGRTAIMGNPFYARHFSDDPLVRAAADGAGFLVVRRTVPPSSRRDSVVLELHDASGRLQWRRMLAYTPRPTERVLRDSLKLMTDYALRDLAGRVRTSVVAADPPGGLAAPSHYPPVSEAIVGRNGWIWVQLRVAGVADGEWMALDGSGRPLHRVALPPGSRLVEADEERLWAVSLDGDDVPTVTRYGY